MKWTLVVFALLFSIYQVRCAKNATAALAHSNSTLPAFGATLGNSSLPAATLNTSSGNNTLPANAKTWGKVTKHVLGIQTVSVKSSILQVKNHTFTYAKNSKTIVGFMAVDHKSHPVKVNLLGKLPAKNITIQIISQRGHGINSTFTFYSSAAASIGNLTLMQLLAVVSVVAANVGKMLR